MALRYKVWVEHAELWAVLAYDLTKAQANAVVADIRKGSERYPNVKKTAKIKVLPEEKRLDMYTGEEVEPKLGALDGVAVIEQVKARGGRMRFGDRNKQMNRPDGPRWTAFVSVFGRDVVGEGDTKESAVAAALRELPDNLRSHFTLGALGALRAPSCGPVCKTVLAIGGAVLASKLFKR